MLAFEGGGGQVGYSEAVALLLPDAIVRPEVVGVFCVFLIVLATLIGLGMKVFRRR